MTKTTTTTRGGSSDQIHVWTDGSCLKNPGAGGMGIVLDHPTLKGTLSLGFHHTTNNRMELGALIYTMFYLHRFNYIQRGDTVHIYTDSNLLVKGVTEWLDNWVKQRFVKRENADLWQIIYLYKRNYNIVMHKVAAHVGIEINEQCDQLAKAGANLPNQYKRHDLRYERDQTLIGQTKIRIKEIR